MLSLKSSKNFLEWSTVHADTFLTTVCLWSQHLASASTPGAAGVSRRVERSVQKSTLGFINVLQVAFHPPRHARAGPRSVEAEAI